MIGIKDQCFGVEIELTGITRAEAAEALGMYFGTPMSGAVGFRAIMQTYRASSVREPA